MKYNNFVDENTFDNLGLRYVLNKLNVLTPFGIEKKKNLAPFTIGKEEKLKKELNRIEYIITLINENEQTFTKIKSLLIHIKDIRNSIDRVSKGQVLSTVEIFEIKSFLLLIEEIYLLIDSLQKPLTSELIVYPLYDIQNLLDPLKNKIKNFYIYDEYSNYLEDVRKNKRYIQNSIKREITKIKEDIKSDLNLKVNLNNEISVSKSDTNLINIINDYPLLTYKCESYMDIKYCLKPNDMISKLNVELNVLNLEEEKEEYKVRENLCKKISQYSEDILKTIDIIADLDMSLSKAYMGIEINGVKPIVTKNKKVRILEGRYLELEDILEKGNQKFTPISVSIDTEVTCITGANMGGKTVSLKLIGLLVGMIQYGLFVPCREMETCLFDFLHASIGDLQSVNEGLSTFGAEINSIKFAIKRSDELGLILIDELASGTNPIEGYAISKSLIEFLKKKNSLCVITTHYDNIANIQGVKNLQVIGLRDVDYKNIENLNKNNYIKTIKSLMDYRLIEIKNNESVPKDALNIARLMGLNEDILENAEKILNSGL